MQWVTWSLAILVVAAIGGLVIIKEKTAKFIGACGCLFGCAVGIYGAAGCLFDKMNESDLQRWNAPFASLNFGLDSFTALFLIPALFVGAMAGLSALGKLPGHYSANRPREHWLFFNATLAAIVLLALARNAVAFLFAWELLTVASFLLIENSQRGPSATGGCKYLVAGHGGAACLLAMFAFWGAAAEKLDFNNLSASGSGMTVVFLLAFVGFGSKAGLFPFHFWYAESYLQAPSHAGAILSGAVGNMAIYGLVRVVGILADSVPPPLWWGVLLIVSGLITALLGALFSLRSHYLPRLLAWSSAGNYGLMAIGIGFGLIGTSLQNSLLAVLGFSAAILHMINHSVAKAALFVASGSIYAKCGTRVIDRMGGLAKAMPVTAFLFLIGGMGAAAIPPLNGFASVFLLLLPVFLGVTASSPVVAATLLAALAALGLAGGVAAAAFAKAYGFIFLGVPRMMEKYPESRERRSQLVPLAVLAAAALAMVAATPTALALIKPAVERIFLVWQPAGASARMAEAWLAHDPGAYYFAAVVGSLGIVIALAAAWAVRKLLVMGKKRQSARYGTVRFRDGRAGCTIPRLPLLNLLANASPPCRCWRIRPSLSPAFFLPSLRLNPSLPGKTQFLDAAGFLRYSSKPLPKRYDCGLVGRTSVFYISWLLRRRCCYGNCDYFASRHVGSFSASMPAAGRRT